MTSALLFSRRLGLVEHLLEIEGNKWDTVTLVELVLELDPVQSESMQGALEEIHQHNDREDHRPEDGEKNDELHEKNSKVIIRIYCQTTYHENGDNHAIRCPHRHYLLER